MKKELIAKTDIGSSQSLFTITDDPSLKTSEIVAEMSKHFQVWVYNENLDKDFPTPTQKTTRSFKKNVEADEEHENKSYDDLEREGILQDCITLRERFLMELQYFQKTGEHLDMNNATLCAGSRHPLGGVLYVGWSRSAGEVFVHWCDPHSAYVSFRARVAVS